MTDPVFQLQRCIPELKWQRRKVDILHGITLDVATRRDRSPLRAPSGSGSLRCLMVMGGLERATRGSVRALG